MVFGTQAAAALLTQKAQTISGEGGSRSYAVCALAAENAYWELSRALTKEVLDFDNTAATRPFIPTKVAKKEAKKEVVVKKERE